MGRSTTTGTTCRSGSWRRVAATGKAWSRCCAPALVSGQMKPGRLYSAPTLAGQLGVSATPVREAMSELAAQGMVEVVRNRGFRVRELSDVELDEITQLRQLIEVPTTAALARSCDPGAIDAIRPLAASIETAARRGDLIGYIEADRRFHLALLALAGNRQLVDVVDRLRAKARLYGIRELAERGLLIRSAAGARVDPRPSRRPRRRGHRAVDAPSPRPRARRVGGAGRSRRLSNAGEAAEHRRGDGRRPRLRRHRVLQLRRHAHAGDRLPGR